MHSGRAYDGWQRPRRLGDPLDPLQHLHGGRREAESLLRHLLLQSEVKVGDEKCLRLTVREDERRFTRNNLQQAYSMSGTISLLMKVLSPLPLSLLSDCSSTSLLEGRPRF